LADAPNGANRKETAAWAIGAAAAGVVTSFSAAVQVIQAPLERDLAALSRRLDEAIVISNQGDDEMREQFRAAVADALARGEERRLAMSQQQTQINSSYGSALGDLASRVNRIEADRQRIIESATARIQRTEDHVNVLDNRLVGIEENFVRVLRGDAARPDRMGGPPYPSRDQ
jgi:hypothetical protein